MLAIKHAIQSGAILCEFHKDMKQNKEKKNKENKCSCLPMVNDRFNADCLLGFFSP